MDQLMCVMNILENEDGYETKRELDNIRNAFADIRESKMVLQNNL